MHTRKKTHQLAKMLLTEIEALQQAQPDTPTDNLLILVNEIIKDAKGLAEDALEEKID